MRNMLFKVDKVLVAIHAEKAGLIEHGLARREPRTEQWLYTATAENPEKEDWSVVVTAVAQWPMILCTHFLRSGIGQPNLSSA